MCSARETGAFLAQISRRRRLRPAAELTCCYRRRRKTPRAENGAIRSAPSASSHAAVNVTHKARAQNDPILVVFGRSPIKVSSHLDDDERRGSHLCKANTKPCCSRKDYNRAHERQHFTATDVARIACQGLVLQRALQLSLSLFVEALRPAIAPAKAPILRLCKQNCCENAARFGCERGGRVITLFICANSPGRVHFNLRLQRQSYPCRSRSKIALLHAPFASQSQSQSQVSSSHRRPL